MSDVLIRYQWPIIAVLAAISAICAVLFVSRLVDDDPQPLVIESGEVPSDVRVYIAGAVQHPGVYPMSPDARWIDALEIAGGATDDADLEAVNLARRVQDEAQIVVPRRGTSSIEVAALVPSGGLVNLNTADIEALDTLPGIGEVRAQRIIGSREADGPFAQVEDLILRDLVPDSVFQDILPLVTVN